MKMKISVIVCTKDRFEDMLSFVKSLNSQTLLPNELIVVDASEKEGLEELLKEKIIRKIEFKYVKSKPGLTYQRNVGVKAANGDYLFFFDDDIILQNDYLEKTVDFFKEDNKKKIGGVTGKIVNQGKMKFISRLYRKIFCLSEISMGEIKPSGSNNAISANISEPTKVQWLQGANQIYIKEVFQYVMFDEKLKGYCYMEDVDFSYRVSKRFDLYYLPTAKCIHNHKSSPATRMKKQEKQFMFMINYHYLFKKNIKQTPINLFCHYWSFLGFIVRGIFFERDINFVLGTLKGIFYNLFGLNELVRTIK